jgi:hypothetical protein
MLATLHEEIALQPSRFKYDRPRITFKSSSDAPPAPILRVDRSPIELIDRPIQDTEPHLLPKAADTYLSL